VELSEILSSFAVDLSVSDRLKHPEAATVAACDDRNRVANLSGSSEIVDNGASGCSQPMRVAAASAEVVDETFLRPMSHSTPIRDLPCHRNCRLSFSTGDESNDKVDDDDDEEDDNLVNDFFIILFIIFYGPCIPSCCILLYYYSFKVVLSTRHNRYLQRGRWKHNINSNYYKNNNNRNIRDIRYSFEQIIQIILLHWVIRIILDKMWKCGD